MQSFLSRVIRPGSGLVSLGAVLLFAAAAPAQQTYTIKPTFTVGERWSFDVNSTMKLKGQITANGQVVQPIEQDVNSHRKGVIEVLALDGGLPSTIRVTYDADCTNTGKANGQDLPAFPLAGKTVTLKKDNGTITNDLAAAPDQMTKEELARMLDQDTSMYPKDAVAVDQEWDGDPVMFAKQFQLGQNDQANMKLRLLAVKNDNGHMVADVSIVGKVDKKEQGQLPIESKVMLGGVVRFDLATGHPLNVDIIGKMTMTGSAQIPGQNGAPVNAAADASGELQVHQLSKPVDGGGQGPAANNNPPANVPVPAPAAAMDFGGSYKNDQISLDLTSDGAKVTGSLTIGGKPFPVVAQSDGTTLTGTFESGGTKFNFTATPNGNTLVLTSDGHSYTLQKAVANPLATPAPRNPLGQ